MSKLSPSINAEGSCKCQIMELLTLWKVRPLCRLRATGFIINS